MIVILILLRLLTPGAVEGFRSTDPYDLRGDAPAKNLAAAMVAGEAEDLDPAILLSIAWHESRYQADVVTREPGRKWSCGVMTPEPRATCRPGDLLDGYLAGAKHLRGWIRATGSLRGGLLGYTGGYALIRACREGPHFVRLGVDACDTPWVFLDRASRIRRALARGKAAR